MKIIQQAKIKTSWKCNTVQNPFYNAKFWLVEFDSENI